MVLGGGTVQSGAGTAILNFPTGLFHWQGGTLSGNVTNAGDLVISGGTVYLTDATLTNNATIEDVTGQVQLRNSTIHNSVTGVYNIEEDGDVLYNVTDPSVFNNDGLFEKTGGSGSSQLPGLPLNNSATAVVDAETGALNLSGGGSSTGTKFIALPPVLRFMSPAAQTRSFGTARSPVPVRAKSS